MTLSRWLALIGLCVLCGMVQVSVRHAALAKSYAVGEALNRLHDSKTRVGWLATEVIHLESPGSLAQVAKARNLELVAWHPLPRREWAQVAADYGIQY